MLTNGSGSPRIQTGAAGTEQSKRERRLRALWWLLLSVNVGLLVSALPPFLRGDPDVYLNQHARLIANAASGLLLCASFLVRERLRLWFLFATFGAIGASVWLSSGYAR